MVKSSDEAELAHTLLILRCRPTGTEPSKVPLAVYYPLTHSGLMTQMKAYGLVFTDIGSDKQ